MMTALARARPTADAFRPPGRHVKIGTFFP